VANLQLADQKDPRSLTVLSGRILVDVGAYSVNMISVRDYDIPHRIIFFRNDARVDIHTAHLNQVCWTAGQKKAYMDMGGMVGV